MNPRATPLPAALLAAALPFAGCLPGLRSTALNDAERVARLVRDEARPALQRLDDPDPALRESACRALAADAKRLRRLGDDENAEGYVHWIVDRFEREGDPGVRHAVVALCAPTMGYGGSPATLTFLRRRLAAGDLVGPAALALADLAPEDAYALLVPLTDHPLPAVRADAALALTVLGDPGGEAKVRAVLAEMRVPDWPKQLRGVPLDDVRQQLSARADRIFGSARAPLP